MPWLLNIVMNMTGAKCGSRFLGLLGRMDVVSKTLMAISGMFSG